MLRHSSVYMFYGLSGKRKTFPIEFRWRTDKTTWFLLQRDNRGKVVTVHKEVA